MGTVIINKTRKPIELNTKHVLEPGTNTLPDEVVGMTDNIPALGRMKATGEIEIWPDEETPAAPIVADKPTKTKP